MKLKSFKEHSPVWDFPSETYLSCRWEIIHKRPWWFSAGADSCSDKVYMFLYRSFVREHGA